MHNAKFLPIDLRGILQTSLVILVRLRNNIPTRIPEASNVGTRSPFGYTEV